MPLAPTKSNLLRTKDELSLAQEGYELLDQKREVLIGELMRMAYDLKSVQEEFNDKLVTALRSFRDADLELGPEKMALAMAYEPAEVELDVIQRSVMGVLIPEVLQTDAVPQPRPGPGASCPALEESYQQFQELVPLLTRYVESYTAVLRLATEVKKTQRRVNALENLFIPDYQDTIARVDSVLEENDREAFFRQKQVKRKVGRKG